MDSCVDGSIGSWSRTKNDEISMHYDNDRSAETFRHITYAPSYLEAGSCAVGNNLNCSVFRKQNIEDENRFGQMTNLNEMQRSTTNDSTLGIKTTPQNSTGPLLDPRLLQDMQSLESHHTNQRNRSLFPSSSAMDVHQFDASSVQHTIQPVFGREDIRVSSRVSRRNQHADQKCTRSPTGNQ